MHIEGQRPPVKHGRQGGIGRRKGNLVEHRDDGVTEVHITSRKHGRFTVLVDTADWVGNHMADCTWGLDRTRHTRTLYAKTTAITDDGSRISLGMHTVVTGRLPADHIDGNGLDNRRSNLRPATPLQNSRNRRRAVNNTSGYTGVFADSGRWRACVWADGVRHYVPGRFDTAAEAAIARDALAVELHGEFARLAA